MRRIYLSFAILLVLSVFPRLFAVEDLKHHTDNKTFDSIDRLIETAFKKNDRVESVRLILEKGKMLHYRALYANALITLDNAIKLSNNGKDTLKYPEMKKLYMECLNIKGKAYSYMAQFEDAINCCIEMDKYNNDKDISYKSKFYNLMGVIFGMNSKSKQAIEYYKQGIAVANKLQDDNDRNSQKFFMYSNLIFIHIAQKEFDSAQLYLMETQKLAVYLKDKKKELVCLQTLGTLNANMGRYELAINYYDESYKLALECKDYYMMPFLRNFMAKSYLELKNYQKAKELAFEGLELAREDKAKGLEIVILQNIATIYKRMGETDNALKYLEECYMIKDSLYSKENEEKFMRQKTDFDMYRVSVEKEMLEKSLALQKSQQTVNNLTVVILILILSAFSVFLTYLWIKQRKINRELNLKHNNDVSAFVDKTKLLEDELEKKNREISMSEFSIAKNHELTSMLMSKLRLLKLSIPLKSKGQEIIKETEGLVTQLSKENHSEDLQFHVEQIASDFYDKVDILYPDLTHGEKRICALLSLGLSSKDIANITGKTRGAIDSVKFRIRRKTNLDNEVNLEEIFFRIRNN